jgi:hypothetical protein
MASSISFPSALMTCRHPEAAPGLAFRARYHNLYHTDRGLASM